MSSSRRSSRVLLAVVGAMAMASVLSAPCLQAGEPLPAATAKSDARPAEKPVTTVGGPAGDLLRKWYAQRTAAGNTGDYYDNRDRGHSDLNMALYPQLTRFAYPEEARKLRLDWAAQRQILPLVVFGNSSTSAGAQQGGSNPRMLYTHPLGLNILYLQYTGNNLYIYPEHCDYDPGHNGTPGGFGDLYPTNSPYLIISQGSSGSDQPFLQAVAMTMAALRPETKKKLIDSGLLMPAIQMIFRISNKRLADPKDYLTGKAHPPVFQGSDVDTLKMVQMAHDIKPDQIPPMIQLRVMEEDKAARGLDYFEEDFTEQLADTSAVIARVCRSRNGERRIVVSAAESYDRNDRPLRWHWVVLRGDAGKIKIKPLSAQGSQAEITVPWHPRRPISEGSPMESSRVDIGVFVHNGVYYSAPGFVTFLFLDHESRTCDGARLLEIGYGMGESEVQVTNWLGLQELLKTDAKSPAARILHKAFSEAQRAAAVAALEEYRSCHAALETARKNRQEAEAQKKPEAELKAARQSEEAAAKAENELLGKRRDALQGSLKDAVVGRLRRMVENPAFHQENPAETAELLRDPQRREAMDRQVKRLAGWGLWEKGQLRGVLGATTPDPARLTRFEKALLEQFHGELLSRVLFPGVVQCRWKTNYVDPQISAPKSWRDVYHYDSQGRSTGWTRYDGQQTAEFNADGFQVLEKDARGRCIRARTVRYEQEKPKPGGQRHFGPNWNPLRWVSGGEVVFYQYDGDADAKGKVAKREKEPPAEKK